VGQDILCTGCLLFAWVSAWGQQVHGSEGTGMDGRALLFGSGLEPESTGSGCWAKEEEKTTPMMR